VTERRFVTREQQGCGYGSSFASNWGWGVVVWVSLARLVVRDPACESLSDYLGGAGRRGESGAVARDSLARSAALPLGGGAGRWAGGAARVGALALAGGTAMQNAARGARRAAGPISPNRGVRRGGQRLGRSMAGYRITPVLVFWTGRALPGYTGSNSLLRPALSSPAHALISLAVH
jgi:hypothetical protein